jgi:hypothetical protein
MNFTSIYLWVTQKISSQYEHFYYRIYNNEKNNLLADVYVSSALGGLIWPIAALGSSFMTAPAAF